jgi:signal recognition particle subunit SEC65/nucleotide-binding universal stress UspA family protein
MLLRELTYHVTEALDAEINAAIIKIKSNGSMWRKVKQGAINSPELKTIQTALTQLGFKTKPDGWFGPGTAKAVRDFQKSKGLKVDGDPGPNTLKAMANAVGGRGKSVEKPGERQAYLDKQKEKPKAQYSDKLDNKDGEIRNPGYKKDMAEIAAYKIVRGSGQGRRYKVFDKDGNVIAHGRGPGPTNVPTKDQYDAKNTSNDPSAMTDIGGGFGSSKDGIDEPPVAIADFSKVKKPEDTIKIASDAIAKAREDGNLKQIAQIASASLANMPNIQTPAEKAEIAKKVIAQIDDSELSNPAVLAALAPAQLAVDVVDAGTDEDALQVALENFVESTYPEAIPERLRKMMPEEDIAKRSMEVIVKKAQEEGLMSQFVEPSKAVKIIQSKVKELSKRELESFTYESIIDDLQDFVNERQVWAKSGSKVVRKYRCMSGKRKGRVVKQPSQCFAAPDIKKRIMLKKTKARLGSRMARKARRTKRTNPTSKRVAQMNRSSR